MTIAYDGTRYHGFQKQKGTGLKTIQETLEKALSTITNENILVNGSGRTDAGVHAKGQVVNFKSNTKIPQEKLPLAVNSVLPGDIVVKEAVDVSPDFHARFNAKRKTYRYNIYNDRHMSPFWRYYAYHVPIILDVEKMNLGCERFIGEHDFTGFCAKDTSVRDYVRTIYNCNIQRSGPLLILTVEGNGFLYNMVRIITGTLLDIGKNKGKPEDITFLLHKKDRSLSGATAPPHGLYLFSVNYSD